MVAPYDQRLATQLRELPAKRANRYTEPARWELLRLLFQSLSRGDQYMPYFFPNGPPTHSSEEWSLSQAQGASEGAEYTEAARGKRCGHIFKNGEATYSCRTCSADATCVLCTKCFHASDHDGHQVHISMSPGTTGCCDCGDPEAWLRPVNCSIHTATGVSDTAQGSEHSSLPQELQDSIRTTVSRVLDYICDVFSCSPEGKLPKNEQAIRRNEEMSRLRSKWYPGADTAERCDEFALVLWNDEKHTLEEVKEQIARACGVRRSYGKECAKEIDLIGRSAIKYSRDLKELFRAAKIVSEIKLTVTIRSSRDLFREEMCGTMIEWLSDIASCSVADDHRFLMTTICSEMLKPWRIGSEAFNLEIAKNGIIDHARSDDRLKRRRALELQRQLRLAREAARAAARRQARVINGQGIAIVVDDDPTGSDEDGDDDADEDAVDPDQEEDAIEDDGDEMDIDEALNMEVTDAEIVEAINAQEAADAMVIEEDGIISVIPVAQPTQAARPVSQDRMSEASEDEAPAPSAPEPDADALFSAVPKTPRVENPPQQAATPGYWKTPKPQESSKDLPIYEDFNRRVRMDFLILYDLRMWKKLRNSLRHLYISTVVTVPIFKRVLGLRFAALYTHLAQLYLVADREPDHSIINLSLQMLTTPSITREIVDKGRFFTRLLAILYTFLTKRQVGHPEEVDPKAVMAFEAGIMTNRRIEHFFSDMRFLLEAKSVQERIRDDHDLLLQFLDFLKLFQGLCPNERATKEHIEYESEAWYTASCIVREVTGIGRQFCESFKWTRLQNPDSICRAIRQTAKATIINSLGIEHDAASPSGGTHPITFRTMPLYEMEPVGIVSTPRALPDFRVEFEPMSFHHALHYIFSWLVDSGKSMSADQLRGLLHFKQRDLQRQDPRSTVKHEVPEHEPEQYLLAMFDVPLRVCVWLAQIKAGMWVRNGITLRHQMSAYRSVGQRDILFQRDIYLLQVGMVVCTPHTFLASILERFGVVSLWVRGIFQLMAGWEEQQVVDVFEDCIHLLIILLCDRTLLFPPEDSPNVVEAIAKRDIIHTLCFKPLTFSELTNRLSNKVRVLESFHDILDTVAVFRAPEGLSDSGTFQLRDEYLNEVDPYNAYYSKSQREEAEGVFRSYKSKQTGAPVDEIFYDPSPPPITSGIFADVSAFTRTELFAQTILTSLQYVANAETYFPEVPVTKNESLLQVVLHLILVAAFEDKSTAPEQAPRVGDSSFIDSALSASMDITDVGAVTILSQLFTLLQMDKYASSHARIRFVLHRLQSRRPQQFASALAGVPGENELLAMMSMSGADPTADKALRKKQALERQAKVMASFKQQQNDFLESQTIDWGVDDLSDSDGDETLLQDQPTTKKWHFPEGNCIFCQEETTESQLYGTLAYISESTILRETPMNDREYMEEVFQTPSSLDRSAEPIRPFGVAGKNVRKITKVTADGTLVLTERRGLGRGFPKDIYRPGPVSTSCGHIMHFSCFETYITATNRRQQQHVQRNHPERLGLKEFTCPLCKALGNTFMPVIWSPKDRHGPETIQSNHFDQWACAQIPFLTANGPELSIKLNAFVSQAMTSLKPHISTFLDAPRSADRTATATSFYSRASLPAWVTGDRSAAYNSSPAALNVSDITKAYRRLAETIQLNQLCRPPGPDSHESNNNLPHSEVLAKALGFSIASVEISQRGIDSETAVGTFIDKIPEYILSHLRIFSETVSSYIAIGYTHNPTSKAAQDVAACSQKEVQQLFCQGLLPISNGEIITPLLLLDSFVFLAESEVYMNVALHLSTYGVLRLCYLAEIVKVVIAYNENEYAQQTLGDQKLEQTEPLTAEQSEAFSVFVQCVWSQYQTALLQTGANIPAHLKERNPNTLYASDMALRSLARTHSLSFLRKALLLMHVRHGIDFSNLPPSALDEPELSRLSRALNLPDFDELIRGFISESQSSATLQQTTSAWIHHYIGFAMREGRFGLNLTHPCIFELVGLPDTHDLLNLEAMSRRCPTTGRELSDPCVCLFCGDIFCGQALCCGRALQGGNIEGGCYQHQMKCAGNIGMYLSIRHCAVLLLNGKNGSFTHAPYMDAHGETDMGLKRHHQLFLNRKRYDRLLRDLWLSQGIPSFICRKLEADINNGGWETI